MKIDDRPEFAIRLEQARRNRGFESAKAAARYFGWSYETYIQHEQGIRGISRQSKRYAKAYQVSEGWLLTGEGEGPGDGAGQIIPVVAWVSAGALAHPDVSAEQIASIKVSDLDPKGDWIAMRVHGDSMDRISPPDSIILVNRKEKRLVPNGCYIVSDGDDGVTYKRFRPNPNRMEPVSTNPVHEPMFFEHEPRVIGRVRKTILDM